MKTFFTLFACLSATLLSTTAAAFSAKGFANPYGIAVNAEKSYIYVSNVNGSPAGRADAGFISRMKGDGSVDKQRFIDGASPQVTLNAPKGMAVAEGRIYVADIEKLRAFDEATGKFLFDVNFGDLPVQHFYDVTLGPDRALYVADGPANVIYRVDLPKQHEVTVFISDAGLGQPHGIVWFPGRQVFAVAGSSSGEVNAYDRGGIAQTFPSIFLRSLEGITADNAGNMYVASSALSAVYRIAANFSVETFWLGVGAPRGVAFSSSGNEVVAASFEAGTVESRQAADETEKPGSAVMDYVPPAPAEKTPVETQAESKAGTQAPVPPSADTKRPSADEMQKAIEESMPKPEAPQEKAGEQQVEEQQQQTPEPEAPANGG